MCFRLLRKRIVQQIGHALVGFRHFSLIHYIHILKLFAVKFKIIFQVIHLTTKFRVSISVAEQNLHTPPQYDLQSHKDSFNRHDL